MSNPKAFEGYRDSWTFKAKDPKAPNKASLNIRIPEAMKAKIVEIPGWQDKVRAAIAQIIANQV
jgi:hypothetical protein